MAAETSKSDIQAIFKRLRSIQTNKQCFDCGASNPTWASVTYGVFLCIDCSAVHRSLGVHLTFIRSTQLDTSWTWLQLRAMQTGGNANATGFFRQHGCTSTDAQQKYNSRAASMYREKLHHLASKAMQTYGTKLHLDSHGGLTEANSPEMKEVDFFKEHHDNWQSGMSLVNPAAAVAYTSTSVSANSQSEPVPVANGANNLQKKAEPEEDDGLGPSVEHALSISPTEAIQKQEPRKATIGARKPAKKSGLGGTKKGLGAQKVKANFSQIEQVAQQKDKDREEIAKTMELQQSRSKEEDTRKMASLKLAYKDLSLEDNKRAETAKKMDPKKAEQLERLGMAYSGASRGASHSVTSDMQTIEQENPTVSRNTFEDRYSSRNRNKDLEDDFEILGGFSSGPPKYDSPFGLKNEDRYSNSKWGNSSNENGGVSKNVIEDIPAHKPSDDGSRSRGYFKNTELSSTSDSDVAQKKFGSAKAISSDMYFGKKETDFETKQTLSRFEGSTGISSADFHGGGPGTSGSSNKEYYDSGSDLTEIRDSVRQGVNKVAGRLSSIANGVINSLQDNYG